MDILQPETNDPEALTPPSPVISSLPRISTRASGCEEGAVSTYVTGMESISRLQPPDHADLAQDIEATAR